jgi:hypothetical protein
MVSAVDESLAVVLVVETAHHPRHGRTPNLLPTLRWSRIVDHRFGVRHHRADEGDVTSVRRPRRACCPLRDRAQLAWFAAARSRHDKELIRGADPADEGDTTAVRRPLWRVIPPRAGHRVDWFGVQQAANHHPASVLARVSVRPAQLVGDTFAVPTESDMTDPAKAIEVIGSYRDGHGVLDLNSISGLPVG